MWIFFQLMATSVPAFLPLVLPIGAGVATVFIYHKLAIDSELVVMRAVGVSPFRQALPALALAGIVVLVCYVLTLWLTPMANRTLVSLEYQMRDNDAILLARPGTFNDVAEGLTFYARARGPNGALEDILLHDVRKPDTPVTIMAERGQVTTANGQPQLVIFNGRRQEIDTATGQVSQLAFEQYVLDINSLRNTVVNRMPDPREQSVSELLDPSPEMLAHKTTRAHLLSEFYQRLASPLLALSYAVIGLAAILAGPFNRRGMNRRILLAAALVIAVQAGMMSLQSLVAREIWFAAALYIVPLAAVVIGLGFLTAERRRAIPAAPKAVAS